ncbi:MAG: hypothetical protein KDB63_22970 [Nocardioidaceae bacterium]|nr:hypothetical protein [Nocardioidaceae bacterium]
MAEPTLTITADRLTPDRIDDIGLDGLMRARTEAGSDDVLITDGGPA